MHVIAYLLAVICALAAFVLAFGLQESDADVSARVRACMALAGRNISACSYSKGWDTAAIAYFLSALAGMFFWTFIGKLLSRAADTEEKVDIALRELRESRMDRHRDQMASGGG